MTLGISSRDGAFDGGGLFASEGGGRELGLRAAAASTAGSKARESDVFANVTGSLGLGGALFTGGGGGGRLRELGGGGGGFGAWSGPIVTVLATGLLTAGIADVFV